MFNRSKRRPPTTTLSKKLHSLPSSIRRIIQKEAAPARTHGQAAVWVGATLSDRFHADAHPLGKMSTTLRSKLAMRNRRTLPSRQRTYRRLRARVDRLEDAISHFYNVINELHRRVSTLEKKLKPLAKDDLNGSNGGRKSPQAAAGRRDS
jgi:predicted RNase H-like nuclease (RuvC/YqgF family)